MNRYLTPIVTSIAVFIFLVAILFSQTKTGVDQLVLGVCFIYAFICLIFLIFQLFAFINVHVDYDEDTEKIKYKVLEAEGIYLDLKDDII